MIYTTTKNISRIFYFDAVTEVSVISINFEQDNFDDVIFKYSYSYDDITFVEWFTESAAMIQHIQLQQTPHTNIYVRVLMDVIKNSRSLEYAYCTVHDVLINGASATVSGIEQVKDTSNVIQYSDSKHLYQPYSGLDDAHALNKKLAYAVGKMFSFKCTYFKTSPQTDTASVVFKSYRLSNTTEQKELEINIVDNELPDNRFNYSEWDADFFDQLEIHIVIELFDEAFPNELPNADDYLYLPLTNRMYQINTINEVKDFMNKSTYYQAILVKWEDRADVNDDATADKLPEFAEYVDNFEEDRKIEETDTATKSYNEPDVNDINNDITEDTLTYESMNVMQYMYDLSVTPNTDVALAYNVSASESFAVMLWLKSTDMRNKKLFDVVDTFGLVQFTVSTDNTGTLVLDYSNKVNSRSISAIGTPMMNDTKYAVLLNYSSNPTTGKILTISANDASMNVIQENVVTEFDEIIETSVLQIYGGISVSNIRVSKSIVLKDDIDTVLSDKHPDAEGYCVIDNVTPSIVSDRYRTR